MQLVNFLNASDISVESRILNKTQIYEHLVENICRHHPLPTCGKELLELILKRDAEATTAYSTGIAIPHVRMEGFSDTVVAMTFLQNPVDFQGIRVNWVVLIVTDKSSSKIYLNIVSALLGISKDKDAFASLASAQDGHAALHLLHKMEVEVKKDLSIADIMIKNPVRIGPEALLNELSVLMNTRDISAIPVVDSTDNYLGEVNILNFLGVGVPNYLMMIDNLNFLLSFEPLEHLFEKLDVVHVSEIMNKDDIYLNPEASIIEAVRMMIQTKKRLLSVVDKGKLVGVVTAMDVFRKVIQA